jgi:signal transduction histidine kinase
MQKNQGTAPVELMNLAAATGLRARQEPDQLRQLAAGMAHDYNNLLTSMLCGAGLALKSLAPDHPARPALEIASSAGERAADLTRQLMAYAGINPFEASRVNLPALVGKLVVSLRPSVPDCVQLRLDLAAGLPPLRADSGQIEQLLRILIANAVEAIGDRAAGTVSIRAYAGQIDDLVPPGPARCVHVEIGDTGCGMDDWTRCRIFEPFFSTKLLGRGLGLAAAAGIVRAHGGTLEVHSAPGAGSTFRVSLAALDEPENEELKWQKF